MEHGHHGHEITAHDATGRGDQAAHGQVSWTTAAQATLHCLTGCAIGEILGMVIGTALGWHDAPTMVLAIALAFLFGYAFTLRAALRVGLGLRTALRVALAADTLSIAVMEFIDNGVLALTPGAMEAELSDWLFWAALTLSLVAAFLLTTPVNRWMIGRGKGHAVMHRYTAETTTETDGPQSSGPSPGSSW